MTLDYSDRHVVVTGGAGALGSAVVQRLVEANATVHVPAYSQSELDRFDLANNPRVHAQLVGDLGDEQLTVEYYASLPALWASVQVAGGFAMAPITETSLTDFRGMFTRNAESCFLCCREAIKRIRATDTAAGGRLVNVSAGPALTPTAGMLAYSVSKAAVANMTLALGEELACEGIWVNAIVPAIIDTPANRRAMPDADFSKWAKTSEIAETIAFLASPANRVTRNALVPTFGWS